MTLSLDRLDRQLVHALGMDGRASYRRLSSVLRASEQTIARRYSRLRASEVVRVVALPRPPADDQGQLLRLHVKPGSADKLGQALARRADVAWVRLAAAGAEVICGVRAESSQHRDHLVLEQIPGTGRVTNVTSYALLHHFRTPGRADWDGFPDPLDEEQRSVLTQRTARGRSGDLAERDQVLLAALVDDARQSAASLAHAIGSPEPTVRRRLETLLASGVVHIDVDIDHVALGYPVAANLYLDVEAAELHAVGSTLARHSQTMFVAAVSGPANVFAVAACESIDALYRYTTTVLAGVPGIRSIETTLTSRYFKHARTIRR